MASAYFNTALKEGILKHYEKRIEYCGMTFNMQYSGKKQSDGKYHVRLNYDACKDIKPVKFKVADALKKEEGSFIIEKNPSLENASKRLYGRVIEWRRKISTDDATYIVTTLPVFWNIWRETIAKFMSWSQKTLQVKEAALNRFFMNLPNIDLRELTIDDLLEAAKDSIFGHEDQDFTDEKKGRKYKVLIRSISAIFDAAALAYYITENPIAKYNEMIRNPHSASDDIHESFKKHNIGSEAERQLLKRINEGICRADQHCSAGAAARFYQSSVPCK